MLKIYGVSDDLMEIDGRGWHAEINCGDRPGRVMIGDESGGLIVTAEYAKDVPEATWLLGVSPVDEDVPIPWPVSVQLAKIGYSCVLEIDCPHGTPIIDLDTDEAPK